jgi:hypothetical protein
MYLRTYVRMTTYNTSHVHICTAHIVDSLAECTNQVIVPTTQESGSILVAGGDIPG